MRKTLFFLAIFFAAFAVTAQATGLSVQPSSLEVSGIAGWQENVRLRVQNPSNAVAIFEAYPDEFDSFIKVVPAQFILEAGEQKDVIIKITPGTPGVFQTNISVVSRPLGQAGAALAVGSGVKIPLRVAAGDRPAGLAALIFQNWGVGTGAAVVLVAALAAVLLRRRRAG